MAFWQYRAFPDEGRTFVAATEQLDELQLLTGMRTTLSSAVIASIVAQDRKRLSLVRSVWIPVLEDVCLALDHGVEEALIVEQRWTIPGDATSRWWTFYTVS